MSSPIAHIATGAFLAWFLPSIPKGDVAFWRWFLLAVIMTMAPDADALIGILSGNLGAWHNQASHSLIAGLVVAALILPFAYRFLTGVRLLPLYGVLCLFYGLHLSMDFLTYGRGIKLLWPLSDMRFRSPILLFYGLRWSDGLVSAKHWFTLFSEGAYVMLLVILTWMIIRFKRRNPTSSNMRNCTSDNH